MSKFFTLLFSRSKFCFKKIKKKITRWLKRHRWPKGYQWARVFQVLTKKEKIVFFSFFILFLGSVSYLFINFYYQNTEIKPAKGGVYQEGIIGYPRFINPIYGTANDIDRDLIEIIFSGLMRYDGEVEVGEARIVPDLAKNYQIKEEGKIYEFKLKENVQWHDGEKLTADDIIFTIKTIQNPDFKSPLRANWLGVEVEKISDYTLRFKLKNPYSPFLERLTLKIIPEHIWKDVSPQSFPLSIYNLKPVGSGPYQLKDLKQGESGKILSLDLKRNQNYYDELPYLSQISFHFFEKEEDLISWARGEKITGFSLSSPRSLNLIEKSDYNQYSFSLPRYFALFFNPEKNKLLEEKEIREALNYGTNKEEILEKAVLNQGKVIQSPLLPEIYGYLQPSKIYLFDPERAESILDNLGFEKKNGKRIKIIEKENATSFRSDLRYGAKGSGVEELQKCLAQDKEVYPEAEVTGYFGALTQKAVIKFQEKYAEDILQPFGLKEGNGLVLGGTREKLNEVCGKIEENIVPLKFSLLTVEDPILVEAAEILKNQWSQLGIELEIKTSPISSLKQDFIKPRNYEMLLFGEALGLVPDPFPFWHSSQIKDPGLNLAKYENKEADKLLEEARTILDTEIRSQKYQELQNILAEDAPAVFLYSLDYLYLVSKEIKNINEKIIVDPSKRFSGIESWYVKTKRAWK